MLNKWVNDAAKYTFVSLIFFPDEFSLSLWQISLDPIWTPLDEDQNDFPTYTIVSGNTNNYFAINPTTGVITSTLKYDIDQSAMPTTQTIVVQVCLTEKTIWNVLY